jgi:hypothetical protein
VQTSEQLNELFTALAAAQGELPVIAKTKEATVRGETKTGKSFDYKYKYADISDVLHAVLPTLAKHKLSLAQPTVVAGNALMIRTRLGHASGQWIESEYPVCGLLGDHQKMGSAMTYARRYALCSLLGVAADEDIDGQGAAAPAARNGNGSISARAKADGPRLVSDATLNGDFGQPNDGEEYDDSAARLAYVAACTAIINATNKTRAEVLDWWKAEAQARRDFGLNQLEINMLKSLIAEKFPEPAKVPA